VILQLRAVLRGISPLIWRRLLVPSDTSIAQLHEVLQVAFGWDDMYLHRFEIRGREYGLSREGGMFFDTDARKARIGDLKLGPGASGTENRVKDRRRSGFGGRAVRRG
jgi:Plasmid pRiA4b ORF-3-like protein